MLGRTENGCTASGQKHGNRPSTTREIEIMYDGGFVLQLGKRGLPRRKRCKPEYQCNYAAKQYPEPVDSLGRRGCILRASH